MPLWIGNGTLKVVATRDLGGVGPDETEPVSIEWRWYYHVPGMAIWILVAALLVLVKENRNWQAWTVFIPAILLTAVFWPFINNYLTPRLWSCLGFINKGEQADFAFNSLIGAWTALWLMAPWLARRRAAVAFCLALVFLLASGTVAHMSAFSAAQSWLSSTVAWFRYLFTAILWYGTCAVAMLLGMTLAAIRSQNGYRPRRFLAWLAVGGLAVALVGTAVYICRLCLSQSGHIPIFLLVLGGAIEALGVAAFTYLVNLPFLYLAHYCPCYRSRLKKVLRLPDTT